MTHGIDTIIWNLLEETFRQRVGRIYIYHPEVPVSKDGLLGQAGQISLLKELKDKGPLFVLLYIFMRKVGGIWEPHGNYVMEGAFEPGKCLEESWGKSRAWTSARGVHMPFQSC